MNEEEQRAMTRYLLMVQDVGYVSGTAAAVMASMHPNWCRCGYCHAASAASFMDPTPTGPVTVMLCLGVMA